VEMMKFQFFGFVVYFSKRYLARFLSCKISIAKDRMNYDNICIAAFVSYMVENHSFSISKTQ
jgi:hypothetical protein